MIVSEQAIFELSSISDQYWALINIDTYRFGSLKGEGQPRRTSSLRQCLLLSPAT